MSTPPETEGEVEEGYPTEDTVKRLLARMKEPRSPELHNLCITGLALPESMEWIQDEIIRITPKLDRSVPRDLLLLDLFSAVQHQMVTSLHALVACANYSIRRIGELASQQNVTDAYITNPDVQLSNDVVYRLICFTMLRAFQNGKKKDLSAATATATSAVDMEGDGDGVRDDNKKNT